MQKTREELALIRTKCDKSFLFFIRFFFKEIEGKNFTINKHHIELETHFNDVFHYKIKLLNLNLPPRCSKTEMLLFFIARGIGMRHSSNWLYISSSDSLRKKASTKIRKILTHPYFKIMYGVEINKDENSKDVISFVKGGSLTTASIGGQVTGFGAGEITEVNKTTLQQIREFEGCQCWDDLNKMNDSANENANNKKVTDLVFNTLMSRENSEDTPIVHIQQRAGLTDVTAMLMEYYGTNSERHRFVIMPIIDEKGVPLWESKISLEKINELKNSNITSHIFETQYMQNPTPSKGVVFLKEDLNHFNSIDLDKSKRHSAIGSVDVADKGIDFLSFPIGYVYSDKVYITDWLFTRENMDFTIPKTTSLVSDHKLDHLAIETNNHGSAFFMGVSKNVTGVNLIPVYQTANKHSRIINQAQFIRNHFVFRNDYEVNSDYDIAMKNIYRYLKDGSYKIDDGADSLALLALVCRDYFPDRF